MHGGWEVGRAMHKINENRIFIQHEKDKLNFTWENFSMSEFVGLTSNKYIDTIIYAGMPLL